MKILLVFVVLGLFPIYVGAQSSSGISLGSIDSISKLYNSIDSVFDSTNSRWSQQGSLVSLPLIIWDAGQNSLSYRGRGKPIMSTTITFDNSNVAPVNGHMLAEVLEEVLEEEPSVTGETTKLAVRKIDNKSRLSLNSIVIGGSDGNRKGCSGLECYLQIRYNKDHSNSDRKIDIELRLSGIDNNFIGSFDIESGLGSQYSQLSNTTQLDSFISVDLLKLIIRGKEAQDELAKLLGNHVKVAILKDESGFSYAREHCLWDTSSLWFMLILDKPSEKTEINVLLSIPIRIPGEVVWGSFQRSC